MEKRKEIRRRKREEGGLHKAFRVRDGPDKDAILNHIGRNIQETLSQSLLSLKGVMQGKLTRHKVKDLPAHNFLQIGLKGIRSVELGMKFPGSLSKPGPTLGDGLF